MLNFREATNIDSKIYFDWANDLEVRQQSFNSNNIEIENHNKWFESKLKEVTCTLLIFQNEENSNIGQIRIQKEGVNEALIGISIDRAYRGRSYAKEMLILGSNYFLNKNPGFVINAYIKEKNGSSKKAFENAGYEFVEMVEYENFLSYHYKK